MTSRLTHRAVLEHFEASRSNRGIGDEVKPVLPFAQEYPGVQITTIETMVGFIQPPLFPVQGCHHPNCVDLCLVGVEP